MNVSEPQQLALPCSPVRLLGTSNMPKNMLYVENLSKE